MHSLDSPRIRNAKSFQLTFLQCLAIMISVLDAGATPPPHPTCSDQHTLHPHRTTLVITILQDHLTQYLHWMLMHRDHPYLQPPPPPPPAGRAHRVSIPSSRPKPPSPLTGWYTLIIYPLACSNISVKLNSPSQAVFISPSYRQVSNLHFGT